MTMLALDTNAYRALDDNNQVVVSVVAEAQILGLPVIVLGELYYGIERGSRKEQNLVNLRRFLGIPRLKILEITPETARIFGELATELSVAGKPIQQNDIWIAALCKQYGFVLATADKGFSKISGLDTFSF